MIRLRLDPADRERFGCDEWLPVDPQTVKVREAIQLQELGFDTPADWRGALRGEEATRPDGSTYRRAGKATVPAMLGLVWLALSRNGHQVGLDALDFDFDAVELAADESGEQGKDPSTPATTSTS